MKAETKVPLSAGDDLAFSIIPPPPRVKWPPRPATPALNRRPALSRRQTRVASVADRDVPLVGAAPGRDGRDGDGHGAGRSELVDEAPARCVVGGVGSEEALVGA